MILSILKYVRESLMFMKLMLKCFSPLILTESVTDPRSAFPCSGGESQALARLKHYFWDTVSTTSITDLLNCLS